MARDPHRYVGHNWNGWRRDVRVAPPGPCECGHEKGIHFGRGHDGECMEIGCNCKGYREKRPE